jgi:trk system potassium uptake protein TrkH
MLRPPLARLPLWIVAATAVYLAWPLDDSWTALLVLGAVGLPLTEHRTVHARGRLLATLAFVPAPLLALWQRPDEAAFGLLTLIGATTAVLHVWRHRLPGLVRMTPGVTAAAAAVLVLAPDQVVGWRWHALGLLGGLGVLVAVTRGRRPWTTLGVLDSPARTLVLSFLGLAGLGTFLLASPWASTGAAPPSFLDAAFTAISASCVTGLVVLDTPVDFSRFGQGVLLLLIQAGGLGIMTFAALGLLLLGRRLGVQEERVAAALVGTSDTRAELEVALRTIVKVTLWAEGLGAALLWPLFVLHGDAPAQGAWRALFTSVSAFCNAGFALQSDSLEGYASSPAVLGTISALIVIGGLGPLVVVSLPKLRGTPGMLHARIVLWVTTVLLVVPASLFLALEWDGTLGGLGVGDKVMNAWFQSVTLRTAGFNSVDFGAIQPATWTVSVLCMFVGGSPGSTAGGVKTTSIAVLLLAVTAAARGHRDASAFGRRIPPRVVHEATAVVILGVGMALAALLSVQVTQGLPLDQAAFEVVSALATVGLSMGATAQLDEVGKVLIAVCMFVGRVGPLTLVIFLVGRSSPARQYPMETVQVG